MMTRNLHTQNIIACLWDFDKTLIPGYMQAPLFRRFGINEARFWDEVNALPEVYRKAGLIVSPDTIYLNHLITYVKSGHLKGLSNALLEEIGAELVFNPGLPGFFQKIKDHVAGRPDYQKHDIRVEHYIISTGLGAMIRGSAIAPYVDGIYGCEFIEEPMPQGYLEQPEFELVLGKEISQIGMAIDNTIKTRFIFEINKGCNRNPEISVNSNIRHEDRRVPFENMIYVADGPSDIPVFSVVKGYGGRTYAVYHPQSRDEFAQNDRLLQAGRIHAYGPSDFTPESPSAMWLKMHVDDIARRVIEEREYALSRRVGKPPRHLHSDNQEGPEKGSGRKWEQPQFEQFSDNKEES